MKRPTITALSVLALAGTAWFVMDEPEPTPRPYKFITLAWDANTEPDIKGYQLWMGVQSGKPLGSVRMDLVHHLRGLPEVPALVNQPVIYYAVAAYNETLTGPPSDELRVEYPELQTWLAANQ